MSLLFLFQGVATTFDTAKVNKPTITTFSAGDLAVQNTANTNTVENTFVPVECPTTHGLPLGTKGYFEHVCNLQPGANGVGLALSPSHDFQTALEGVNRFSCAYFENGEVNSNGTISNIQAYSAGNTICWAIDLVNFNIWIRNGGGNWNNSGTANPATNTGGISIAHMNVASNLVCTTPGFFAANCKHTFNFGASSFAQSIPSGFSSFNFLAQRRVATRRYGYAFIL